MTANNGRDGSLVAGRTDTDGEVHAFGLSEKLAKSYCGNVTMDPNKFDQVMEAEPLKENLDRVSCQACRYSLNLPGGAEYER